MNLEKLQSASKKDLTDKARSLGVAGYSSMAKDELIKAISRAMKKKDKEREKAKAAKAKTATVPAPSLNGRHHVNGKPTSATLPAAKKGKVEVKKPAEPTPAPVPTNPTGTPRHLQGGHAKDRAVVVVRDPYWLHIYWELTHQSVQRAEAALGQDWHGAKPILRVCDVGAQDTTGT